jgi:SnoaL-like domain
MNNDTDEIRKVLVSYATAIDTRDWTMLRRCFTADAHCDYGDIGSWLSADELVAFMDQTHLGFGPTKHILTNFVIDIDGDQATSCTYIHAVLTVTDASGSWIEFIGDQNDQLVRTAQGWRVSKRVLRQTRLLSGGGNLAGST